MLYGCIIVFIDMEFLSGLNPSQSDAVMTEQGPLLILAGPGSGKTRVITSRIAFLVRECAVDPSRIAAVTFTNKAAREMRDRLFGRQDNLSYTALLPEWQRMKQDLAVATFHSFCASILRDNAEKVGLNRSFVIFDQEDQINLINRAMEIAGLDPKRLPPRALLSGISNAKSRLIEYQYFVPNDSNPLDTAIRTIYPLYEGMLSQNNAVDFDNLLLKTYVLFRDDPATLQKYQSKYLHILVDEFQDTNIAQYAIARQIAGSQRNICVVGDPDQSIYSWRNADIRNILSFQRDYPEAKVINLNQNYRSTQNILEAAREVISPNINRIDKVLVTQNDEGSPVYVGEALNVEDEAQDVIKEIQRLIQDEKYNLRDCAVMYRVNAQSRSLEEMCLRYRMPYKLIGGLRFYQRKEIKDLISYLRVINNPYDDISLNRIMNVPPRGIGQKTLTYLSNLARTRNIPIYSAMQLSVDGTNSSSGIDKTLDTRSSKAVRGFLGTLNLLIDGANDLGVAALMDQIIGGIGYKEYLIHEGDQGRDRWENIQELRSTAVWLDEIGETVVLPEFLQRVALVSDVDMLEDDGDSVTLITLHQAKGLEFPIVFIVGLEEELLPHIRSFDDPNQLEEERRLFYVGMTRAQERLYIMRAFKRGYKDGGSRRPSRFLHDLPMHLIAPMPLSIRKNSILTQRNRAVPEFRESTDYLSDGQKVRHHTFGEGVVVSSKVTGDDCEVMVAFSGSTGIKRLLLRYAGLEMLDRDQGDISIDDTDVE